MLDYTIPFPALNSRSLYNPFSLLFRTVDFFLFFCSTDYWRAQWNRTTTTYNYYIKLPHTTTTYNYHIALYISPLHILFYFHWPVLFANSFTSSEKAWLIDRQCSRPGLDYNDVILCTQKPSKRIISRYPYIFLSPIVVSIDLSPIYQSIDLSISISIYSFMYL